MQKLRIEVDQEGNVQAFIDDSELGVCRLGAPIGDNLIDSINFNYKYGIPVHAEITFRNLLGGLFEGAHKQIILAMRDSIKKIREFETEKAVVDASLRFQLNTERLFDHKLEPKEVPESAEFKAGYKAAKEGKTYYANPYNSEVCGSTNLNPKFVQWHKGFQKGLL